MFSFIISAALALSSAPAAAPPSNTCDEHAELMWHLSGGQDAAWENAIAECENL